jgi:hypothetical protein
VTDKDQNVNAAIEIVVVFIAVDIKSPPDFRGAFTPVPVHPIAEIAKQ